MHPWTKRLLAIAVPLLLTGCLWGPGKFTSDLTLKRDGSFALDYRGEIVLMLPPDENKSEPWDDAAARCYEDGRSEIVADRGATAPEQGEIRACTAAELAKLKAQYDRESVQSAAAKIKESEKMAKVLGLPGSDDESSRAFAAKLMKYDGWRSVTYRGDGVYDVDYHFEGRATQDFLFPALPDNDIIIPFIAMRRRTDGSVHVTAPALAGGAGPLGASAGAAAASAANGPPPSRAEGRLTIVTDGEILTNNSEDGTAPHPLGKQVRWEIGPGSKKVPETLIRL
jgi:hypothetical protein